MRESLQGMAVEGRRIYRTIEETIEGIWKKLVLPLLGLFLWITLVTTLTKFSATHALLVVLAFSVWYAVLRICVEIRLVFDELSTLNAYIAQLLLHSVPGATSVRITTDGGRKQALFNQAEQQPSAKIAEYPDLVQKYIPRNLEQRGPKGK